MNDAELARALMGIAKSLTGKKGEVPEAFKKQWKDKDKDNDGKENEPMPEGLKKHLQKKKGSDRTAKKGEVPEAFKKQWKDDDRDNDGKKNEPMPEGLKKSLKEKGKKGAVAARLVALAETLVADEEGVPRNREAGTNMSFASQSIAGILKGLTGLLDERMEVEMALDVANSEGEDTRIAMKQFYAADDHLDKAIAGYKRLARQVER